MTPSPLNKAQAADLLHQVPDEQVRIWQDDNQDYHIVIVAGSSVPKKAVQPSKWAKAAAVMAEVNLSAEAAKMLAESRKSFREGFAFRDINLSGKQ